MYRKDSDKAVASISVATGKAIYYTLNKLGCKASFYDICDRYGVSERLFNNDQNRIPLDAVLDFAHKQAIQLQDPMLGLKIGKVLNLKKLPGSMDLLFVAHDVKQAFEMFNRYTQVFSDVGRFELVRDSYKCRMVFNPNSDNPYINYLLDGIMMVLFKYMRNLGVNIFTSVHLSTKCPEEYHTQYEREFNMPVFFNNQKSWFEVIPDSLSQSLDDCQNPSFKYFSEAEKILSHSTGESSVDEQIVFILHKMISTRQVSVERMAGVLSMNVRTLQRRLKEKNMTYKKLLESARQSLAIEYLVYDELTIEQISKQLGYTDTSNFYRAFKNWTGMRPVEYRNAYQTAI